MTCTTVCRATILTRLLVLPLLVTASLAGCGLLEVPDDPTAIGEADLNDAAGAQLLRRAALRVQTEAVGQAAFRSGLLADEFTIDGPPLSGPPGGDLLQLDLRESELYENSHRTSDLVYDGWQSVRRAASVALLKLGTYAPPDVRGAHVGQMYALRGFAALRLAEDVCPGFPLHDLVDYKVIASSPLSTEQALERALGDFDSALSPAADSVRILNFARVGRGRALLNLGRYAEAAAAVADVPTGFVYHAEYSSATSQPNPLFSGNWGPSASVADREGGRGLDFVSVSDPRVRTTFLRMAQDGTTRLYGIGKYPTAGTPIVMVSGVEARLIEAEVALRTNPNDTLWLTILNVLRAAYPDTTLSNHPLSDPGTDGARVDLFFRERAFWLFATGTRLSDLRRLVRLYGRSSESVFPTGTSRLGGVYGTASSVPFPPGRETEFNPAVTGCTSR